MQLVTNIIVCIFNQVKLDTTKFTFEGDSSHKKLLHSQIVLPSYLRIIVQQFIRMN